MVAALHRGNGGHSVGMVRRGYENGINIFLIQQAPEVPVGLGRRVLLRCFGEVVCIYVAQGHDVLAFELCHVRTTLVCHANDRQVQFFIR